MRRRTLVAALLLLPLGHALLASPATAQRPADDGRGKPAENRARSAKKLSTREAAARARARHGGEVLNVTRGGQGYRVRLLMDNGRVITVSIED